MALEQSAELRAVVQRYYQAFASGDPAAITRFWSQDDSVLGIGTDPAEWWRGFATLEQVVAAQLPDMRAAGVAFDLDETEGYVEGSVGWCASRLRIRLPDGSATPVRFTGVFHREGGAWKLVQFHSSLGVPNAEALGTEVAT